MIKNRRMFKSYINRINAENIILELSKFGILTYSNEGKRIDSLEVLNEAIERMDILLDNKSYIEFNYAAKLLVGELYVNSFIDMFFYEKIY